MKTYKTFRPTSFDRAGICLPDNQEWLVAPVSRNRDSNCLSESNFAAFVKAMGGESENVQVHRFGHWANGWFEIVLINPALPGLVKQAEELEGALENYPVLDEGDFSEREQDEANATWRNCYTEKERIEYIRKHRSQFDFDSLSDILGCVRGAYFCGYASELINL